jgi:hypothetical protein
MSSKEETPAEGEQDQGTLVEQIHDVSISEEKAELPEGYAESDKKKAPADTDGNFSLGYDSEHSGEYETPKGEEEEPLLDDLVDEEKLREGEAALTEEELVVSSQ